MTLPDRAWKLEFYLARGDGMWPRDKTSTRYHIADYYRNDGYEAYWTAYCGSIYAIKGAENRRGLSYVQPYPLEGDTRPLCKSCAKSCNAWEDRWLRR